MYKSGCFCALLALLCFSVGEVENCAKVRCIGYAGLIGSKEQGLSPTEVAGALPEEGHSRCMGKGQGLRK